MHYSLDHVIILYKNEVFDLIELIVNFGYVFKSHMNW